MLNPELCWQAVQGKDPSSDGRFFFGVVTTGVFCRPSCPARLPLRRNVRFFANTRAAEAAGLRACLRCRPLDPVGAGPGELRIRRLCQFIQQHSDQRLPLATLAAHAGLSPFHLQRAFKAMVGLTPRQYAEAHRVQRLKASLRRCKDVTEAMYDAGFESASRVYERAQTSLGMTPKQYRQGGRNLVLNYACADTKFGALMIAASERGIAFAQFADRPADLLPMLQREFPLAELIPMSPVGRPALAQWISALQASLESDAAGPHLPLDIRATAFQMKVWNYLQSIPTGTVRTYGEVAAALGRPTAARAVAGACARNRIALLIPCHRVIRGDGGLGGYKWGVQRKRAILAAESAPARATPDGNGQPT